MRRTLAILTAIAAGGLAANCLAGWQKIASSACLAPAAQARTVAMLPDEKWWGAANFFGEQMPFDAKTTLEIDLVRQGGSGNQFASLLLSDRGRVIWCERQCVFSFADGRIAVMPEGEAEVKVVEAGKTLRDAYLFASRTYFPPSGRMPDALFFSAPQLNTWIELTYRQNEQDILAYAEAMRANGVPPGVLMIDDTWQAGYGDWRFEPSRFRDPKGMVAKLHAMGYKVILWMCPWVGMDLPAYRFLTRGEDPFREGKFPTGGFLMEPDGAKVHPCEWWNGVSALLDLTHPNGRAWFKGELDRLVRDYGVDGFKLDGGYIRYYCAGLKAFADLPGGDQANAYQSFALEYPVCEYRHSWKSGGQPIVQRLADKDHTWEALRSLMPELIAGGLLGYQFLCPDMIGGGEYHSFLPGAKFDAELFIRSAQVHALCGMMQFSASPWRLLDADGQKIVRDLVRLRQEKFAARFVALAEACAKSGEPMIRAMEYQYPGHGFADIRDQFAMGDFLIVAPQVEKGARTRTVRLPSGTWTSDRGETVVGPATLTVETPLSRLPYFTR